MQVDNGATFAAGIPNFGALGPKILVRPCAAFALLGLSALDPVLGAEDGVVVVLVVDDGGAEEAALVTELLTLEDLALEDVAAAELPLHPERISGTTINDAVAETRVNREKPGIDSSFEGWETPGSRREVWCTERGVYWLFLPSSSPHFFAAAR